MEAIEPSVEVEQDESPSVEAEQVSDLEGSASPESEQVETTQEQGESPSDDGEKPDGKSKYDARMRWKAAQAEREAQEAKEEAQRLRMELEKAKLPKEPEIPPVPDQFDDDFDQKLAARERALAAKAEYDRQVQAYEAETQRLQQEQQYREYQEQQRIKAEREQEYVQRIQASGLSAGEVENHLAKIVQEHPQMPEPMRLALVDDPQSPLIAKYLSENPDEAYALYGMTPYQGTVHIATEIKKKALALKPKPTSTPPPADTLDGGGKTEFDNPYLEGATFS